VAWACRPVPISSTRRAASCSLSAACRRCAAIQNTCPTGITTHNPKLQRGLVVEDKAGRVANYCRNMNKEIDMIAHSCGLQHAREFRREHVRIVQASAAKRGFQHALSLPGGTAGGGADFRLRGYQNTIPRRRNGATCGDKVLFAETSLHAEGLINTRGLT
jgi:Fe-S oxidoreductase